MKAQLIASIFFSLVIVINASGTLQTDHRFGHLDQMQSVNAASESPMNSIPQA